jgi:O-antigen ligase
LLEALLVVAALIGGLYLAGSKNTFFARIWNYWQDVKEPTLSGYFEYLGFNARFIYGDTALNTYQAYPLFGVGLGNYAFYFEQMLPDQPLVSTPEVLRIITPDAGRDRLITAKNLYYRLLAETGLVGLGTFLVFIIALLGSGLWLWLSPVPEERFWGLASLLGLVIFVPAALSFDSFAIPNMWVVFGLISAAARLYIHPELEAAPSPELLKVTS